MGNLGYNPGIYRSLGPGFEEEPDTPDTSNSGGFWDWWRRNGAGASDVLGTGLCIINPRRAGCPGAPSRDSNSGQASTPKKDQDLLYIIIGLVVVLLFILILKK